VNKQAGRVDAPTASAVAASAVPGAGWFVQASVEKPAATAARYAVSRASSSAVKMAEWVGTVGSMGASLSEMGPL
jgi:hypothetical protein